MKTMILLMALCALPVFAASGGGDTVPANEPLSEKEIRASQTAAKFGVVVGIAVIGFVIWQIRKK